MPRTPLSILVAFLGWAALGPVEAEDTSTRVSYVVATAFGASDPYRAAAEALSEHRHAPVVAFDPTDLASLELCLRKDRPRFVAVVARPETIDTNFVRRFLMMTTRLDDDPFPDVSWGLVTGATAEEALDFVRNGISAEKKGLPKDFLYAFVTSDSIRDEGGPEWLAAAGWSAARLGFGHDDPRIERFIEERLADLQGRGLIQMTGCGDPERIWLFDDQRNADPSKHWAYDPAKVGQNPDGGMRWIDAPAFRRLDLFPAVLTSGTCHSGSLRRVYVEGDIVSTFGRSDRVEVYDMPPERSLGLAYIARGVSAAILPVGPNHGWRTDVEVHRMFSTGAPLGEVMQSCYAELVLAYAGTIELGLYDPASGKGADEDVREMMRGGAANRVLYGDPAYAPFARIESSAALAVRGPTPREDGSFAIHCSFALPNHPDFVDQFCDYGSRMYFAVDLPADLAARGLARVVAEGDDPAVAEVRWAIETTPGGSRLHILALSSATPWEGGLGSEAGQTLSFSIEPAKEGEPPRTLGQTGGEEGELPGTKEARRSGSAVRSALETPWAYSWHQRRFGDILEFVESFLAEHGNLPGSGRIRFELDAKARKAADSVVDLELDSQPLRSGLDRLCGELDLAYTVDEERDVIRIHVR
ncbi:MAG: hypothetical protein HY720_30200 [Planctomycetes bacterium]|nr:hypothetical protein [Planctomycetota bacterium]